MRIFVSYNTRDQQAVETHVRLLQNLCPQADVYFAPSRNRAGAYWIQTLGDELGAADAVLLYLGKKVGDWQELEYYEAFRQCRKRGRPRIIPILLDDEVPGLHFLAQFHRLKAGAHPEQELAALVHAALDGADADADAEPLWRQTNPYRGLFSMGTAGAAYFFGRERLTGDLIDHLRTRRGAVQMLVGNSGVGKSSIVQAGVIASLRSRIWPGEPARAWPEDLADSPAWLTVTLAPGEHPVRALALAFARTWLSDPADREEQARKWVDNFRGGSDLVSLVTAALEQIAERSDAEPPSRLLLNIDQCEELYARAEASEAALFSTLVAAVATRPQFSILASIRSDYYGRLQADEPLFAASDRIDVPPMTRAEIEDVIRKPAAALGARFEAAEIVPLIAEATAREAGSLPLLSYMLSEAWESMRRDDASDGVLRFPLGVIDVARPLIERAERFVMTHPRAEDALRRLFTLRVAHVPKEGEAVRRRARRSDCTVEEWTLAIELAGPEWRLLSTGELDGAPVAQVAHEALLRKWPRLTGWLDEAREFLIWKGQLEAARREWEAADPTKRDDAVLMGLAFENAVRWFDLRGDELARRDAAFVRLSRIVDRRRQREVSAREEELRNERERSEQRRRILARVSQIAAAAAVLVAGVFWYLYADADRARTDLEAALLETEEARASAEAATKQAEMGLQRARTEQARLRARIATDLLDKGDPLRALALAIAAFPEVEAAEWTRIDRTSGASEPLAAALALARQNLLLRGHEGSVVSAAFSSDGARIVTGSVDGTARLWDAVTGVQIRALSGHESSVNSAAFSPDGTRIVTASDDGTARLWDAETGEEIRVLRGHEGRVNSAVFSPDGARIVTASDEGTARLWRTDAEKMIGWLRGHGGPVTRATFSPDGTRIVTASEDGTARLWDAATSAELRTLSGHSGRVNSAAFSPDGAEIVTASTDGTARLWNAATGLEVRELLGHENWVMSAAFSPDGARILSSSWDGTARLWNAATGVELRVLRGHEGPVNSAALSPDGARIVTASHDRIVRLWDVAASGSVRALLGHTAPVNSARFSLDGTRIVTASADGTARIWNAGTGVELRMLLGHNASIISAAFSPDVEGARVVTASEDWTAWIWDAGTGKELLPPLRGHKGKLWSAAFSTDGGRIVTASADRTARLWDAATGEEVGTLRHERGVRSAAFSPDLDGTRIVTASDDGMARLWDAATGEEIRALRGHKLAVTSAAFSPDGTRIVTASDDGTARLWDVDTGDEVLVFIGHNQSVKNAEFSPDGTRIVTASDDGTARLWDTVSGVELRAFRGHESSVVSAAFSPVANDARIVTTSRAALLWDAETLDELAGC